MKTQEVELRARISPEEGQTMIAALRARGAEERGSRFIRDIYFCLHACACIEDIEMDAVGSYSMRLRREVNEGQEKLTLNSKTITQPGDHQAWEEHEVRVSDFDEAYALLTRTAFKPFFDLSKTRHVFRLGEFAVNIEDIEDFGGALEIEVMTTLEGQEAAKQSIRDLLGTLGIPLARVVDKSVTNIVMHERARF